MRKVGQNNTGKLMQTTMFGQCDSHILTASWWKNQVKSWKHGLNLCNLMTWWNGGGWRKHYHISGWLRLALNNECRPPPERSVIYASSSPVPPTMKTATSDDTNQDWDHHRMQHIPPAPMIKYSTADVRYFNLWTLLTSQLILGSCQDNFTWTHLTFQRPTEF